MVRMMIDPKELADHIRDWAKLNPAVGWDFSTLPLPWRNDEELGLIIAALRAYEPPCQHFDLSPWGGWGYKGTPEHYRRHCRTCGLSFFARDPDPAACMEELR